ncbi:MAG: DUF4918 family protein [Candidatus Colwellbacteria bacterium]|nr:DUF4918 family protein [Candidatus Colwellbacteria bacterium]
MKKRTFAAKALNFYNALEFTNKLPHGVKIMNPYKEPETQGYLKEFLGKFFADNVGRVAVFGINPGRFGSGITGITFTDPVALAQFCGIPNNLPQVRERSSEFIYEFINHWGGPEKFYRDFFLTAASPLGFTRNGINFNYYDDRLLFKLVKPFIIESIKAHFDFSIRPETAIILGTGKNQKALTKINQEFGFFKKVYAVEHPRFIMQYRRKKLKEYIKRYRDVFSQAMK